MKVWLNGRRRDLRLTPVGKSACWVVFSVCYCIGKVLSALPGHDRLDWLFWVSAAAGLCMLSLSISSLNRNVRSGTRRRLMTADVVSDPTADRIGQLAPPSMADPPS